MLCMLFAVSALALAARGESKIEANGVASGAAHAVRHYTVAIFGVSCVEIM